MKSLCCSTKLHRHFANRFATKLFKGAVVTTKPRRRRRGRGAAAIKEKKGWMGGVVTPRWPRFASDVVKGRGRGPGPLLLLLP